MLDELDEQLMGELADALESYTSRVDIFILSLRLVVTALNNSRAPQQPRFQSDELVKMLKTELARQALPGSFMVPHIDSLLFVLREDAGAQ